MLAASPWAKLSVSTNQVNDAQPVDVLFMILIDGQQSSVLYKLAPEILEMILKKCPDLETQITFRQTCLKFRIDTKVANRSPLLRLPVNVLGNIARHLDSTSLTSFRATHSWLDKVNREMGYKVEFPQLVDKMKDCEKEYYGDHVCDDIMHAIQRQDSAFWMLFDIDRPGPSRYLANITEIEVKWSQEDGEICTGGRKKLKALGWMIDGDLLPRLKKVTFEMVLPYMDEEPKELVGTMWMPRYMWYFIRICMERGIISVCRLSTY